MTDAPRLVLPSCYCCEHYRRGTPHIDGTHEAGSCRLRRRRKPRANEVGCPLFAEAKDESYYERKPGWWWLPVAKD